MKNIITYITESSNKDSMFFGKLSRRSSDDFNFNAGEKVILIKYDTDGYIAQLRSVYNIKKVNKNSVIISHDDPDYQDTIDVLGLKFDKKGIMRIHVSMIIKHKKAAIIFVHTSNTIPKKR